MRTFLGVFMMLLIHFTHAEAIDQKNSALPKIPQKVQSLDEQLKAFVKKHTPLSEDERLDVQVNTTHLNNGLPTCHSTPELKFSEGTSSLQSNAVIVNCLDQPAWRLIVPVITQTFTKILIATRTIGVGDTISKSDIVLQEYDKNRLYEGYFKSPHEVLGLSSSRMIGAGTPFTRRNIKPKLFVHRNHTVHLEYKKGSISVSMIGISKSDGAMNEVIQVLNPTSKKIVEAVVIGEDRATVVA